MSDSDPDPQPFPDFYLPELYDAYSLGLPGDVAFYAGEAVAAGSPVLELGCGTGRILIPTAEAGVSIFGLDRSALMLGRAREKCTQLPPEV
jgi:SAM-dependent methyltransferase